MKSDNVQESSNSDKISKRATFSKDTFKEIKKMAIDLELDIGDKFTPEVFGSFIEVMIKKIKESDKKV